MTVIQPNKSNKNIIYLFLGLGILVFLGVSAAVAIYSQTVNLKHDIIGLSSELEALKLNNAELKNDFYKLTDQKVLEAVAKERGLIQDKNPKWVFASQF